MLNCIAHAVSFFSSAGRPETTASEAAFKHAIDVTLRKHTVLLSCAQRCRWRNCISPAVAPPMRVPCLHRRSKVFRRHRSFPRSNKLKHCLAHLRSRAK